MAGFARGGAKVQLEADGPDATILHYEVDAKVGGKLAQLGARLIDSTAKRLAGEFFTAFAEQVAPSAPEEAEEGTDVPSDTDTSKEKKGWLGGLFGGKKTEETPQEAAE